MRKLVHLTALHHLLNNLVEHQVYLMLYLKTEFEADEENPSRHNGFHGIAGTKRLGGNINMHKPIDIGPLRTLAEDGINDIGIDVTLVVGHGKINQVVGFLRNG